jgi:putative membrane protein
VLALIGHGGGVLAGAGEAAGVVVLGCLAISALVAARRRLGSRGPRTHPFAASVAGLVALALALSPLLDVDERLSAHMLQHGLLVGVAAPLLALGLPVMLLLCLLPPTARRSVHRARQVLGTNASRALWAALVVHVGVVTIWHVPRLYEWALDAWAAHALEHGLFLLTALVLWWLVLGGGTPVAISGARVGVLVLLAAHGALLGALLAFSATPWYTTYAEQSPDALADQQLAGLVMWSLGGIAPVVAAFALAAAWLERGRTGPATS